MENKEYKYKVVHKVWNKWKDQFEIQTTTLTVHKELNTRKEISDAMAVRVDTIISFETFSE